MKQMTRLPMVVVVASTLHGCGYDGEDGMTVEPSPSTGIAFTTEGTVASTDAGDVEGVTAVMIVDAANGSPWAAAEPDRFVIVDYAAWSVIGQPPAAAGAGQGGAAYARWLYRTTGSRNIGACTSEARGVCLGYRRLREATSAGQLVEIFAANQGWVGRESVTDTTVAPGDCLALTDEGGQDRRAAVVLAASADRRWLFTVEGSDDDTAGARVRFRRRPYLVDGALHPDIDGVGKIDVTF